MAFTVIVTSTAIALFVVAASVVVALAGVVSFGNPVLSLHAGDEQVKVRAMKVKHHAAPCRWHCIEDHAFNLISVMQGIHCWSSWESWEDGLIMMLKQ